MGVFTLFYAVFHNVVDGMSCWLKFLYCYQFVPFRNYLSSRYGDVTSGARLASDVLEELPGQFLEYMKKHKIQPRQPQF